MSLIKCPECGRENVSSMAVACPSCGFGIKDFFELNKRTPVQDLLNVYALLGIDKEFFNPVFLDFVLDEFRTNTIGINDYNYDDNELKGCIDKSILLLNDTIKKSPDSVVKIGKKTSFTWCKDDIVYMGSRNYTVKVVDKYKMTREYGDITRELSTLKKQKDYIQFSHDTESPIAPVSKQNVVTSSIIGGAIAGTTGAVIGAIGAMEHNSAENDRLKNYNNRQNTFHKKIDDYEYRIKELEEKKAHYEKPLRNSFVEQVVLGITLPIGIIPVMLEFSLDYSELEGMCYIEIAGNKKWTPNTKAMFSSLSPDYILRRKQTAIFYETGNYIEKSLLSPNNNTSNNSALSLLFSRNELAKGFFKYVRMNSYWDSVNHRDQLAVEIKSPNKDVYVCGDITKINAAVYYSEPCRDYTYTGVMADERGYGTHTFLIVNNDGTIVSQNPKYKDAEKWENIQNVAKYGSAIVGVNSEGKVEVCGDMSDSFRRLISELPPVVDVCEWNGLLFLTEEGCVAYLNFAIECQPDEYEEKIEYSDDKNIVAIKSIFNPLGIDENGNLRILLSSLEGMDDYLSQYDYSFLPFKLIN